MEEIFRNEETNALLGNKNCNGKCVLAMEKKLDSKAVVEFLTVIRDFHNDDQTLDKLKNNLLALHKETSEMLNKKTKEILTMIDNIFLNRRQQQTSFYRLCHKLVRKEFLDGCMIPDESKCICFSEKNLKKYNIDPAANPNIQLVTNFNDIKNHINSLSGALECPKCVEFDVLKKCCTSKELNCTCSAPSLNAQLQVHEAVLDIYENQEQQIEDSWYLTHLKRDAEYYQNCSRSSLQPSDESVDSFEVISHTCANYSKSDYYTEESDTEVSEANKMKVPEHKIDLCNQNLNDTNFIEYKSLNEYKNVNTFDPGFGCNFEDEISEKMLRPVSGLLNDHDTSVCKTDECKKNSIVEQQNMKTSEKNENSLKLSIENMETKLTPAEAIKQSFSSYLNKSYPPFNLKNRNVVKDAKPPLFTSVMFHPLNQKASTYPREKNCAVTKSLFEEIFAKKEPINPSNALKTSFSNYLSKDTSKWLRK